MGQAIPGLLNIRDFHGDLNSAVDRLHYVLFAQALVLAWRTGRLMPFVLGQAAGAAPLVLMGLLLPWWRFLAFHAKRGLQVESLFASIIWLGKHLELWDANYA